MWGLLLAGGSGSQWRFFACGIGPQLCVLYVQIVKFGPNCFIILQILTCFLMVFSSLVLVVQANIVIFKIYPLHTTSYSPFNTSH
jgi:hypothetical protein